MIQQSLAEGHFGKVAIIGVGLIGGSVGLALRNMRLTTEIVGIGRDLSRLGRAEQLGAIDRSTTVVAEGVADADLVLLCTTVGHIVTELQNVLALATPNALVTDVGSTKTTIVEASHDDHRFVGGHPMAGSERGGVDAANPKLFNGATWAITPHHGNSPATIDRLTELAESLGANSLLLTPEDHDAMVALTSHLPHVIAACVMRQASHSITTHPEIQRLAAGSFADATRVAASPAAIWRDVCLTNRSAILHTITAFRRQLGTLAAAIESADSEEIEKFFRESQEAKASWPVVTPKA